MANFDFEQLIQNPLFLAGLAGLTGKPNESGQNILNGLAQAQMLKRSRSQEQMDQARLAQMQAAQNFDPRNYMTTPAQPAGRAPFALGGLSGAFNTDIQGPQSAPQPGIGLPDIASNVASPSLVAAAQEIQNPTSTTPQLDLQGLLTGALKAGYSPSDVSNFQAVLDPAGAARASLANKTLTVAPGSQVINGLGQVIGQNNQLPPGGTPQQLQQLVSLRDQFKPGTDQYAMYDSAINKISGGFDQQMSRERQGDLQAQREFQNQLRQSNQDLVQAQRDQSNQFQVQRQANQFSNQLEKTGIPQADQMLSSIEQRMSKYQTGDIPGFGRVQGLLPNWALGQEGQDMRQALQGLTNVTLKQRSGAQVTDQEFERFKTEIGSGKLMPADRIRQGIQHFRDLLEAQKKNAIGGVSPDALQTYEEQGGLPLTQLKGQAKAAPAAIAPNDAVAELRRRGIIK